MTYAIWTDTDRTMMKKARGTVKRENPRSPWEGLYRLYVSTADVSSVKCAGRRERLGFCNFQRNCRGARAVLLLNTLHLGLNSLFSTYGT